MAEFTLREQADRYLVEELTLEQLNDCMSDSIVYEMRHGERDVKESGLAAEILRLFCDGNLVKEIHGHFDEEEFRTSLAAYLYLDDLATARKQSASAKAS